MSCEDDKATLQLVNNKCIKVMERLEKGFVKELRIYKRLKFYWKKKD